MTNTAEASTVEIEGGSFDGTPVQPQVEIVWEEPQSVKRKIGRPKRFSDEVLAALRANPDRWALIERAADKARGISPAAYPGFRLKHERNDDGTYRAFMIYSPAKDATRQPPAPVVADNAPVDVDTDPFS